MPAVLDGAKSPACPVAADTGLNASTDISADIPQHPRPACLSNYILIFYSGSADRVLAGPWHCSMYLDPRLSAGTPPHFQPLLDILRDRHAAKARVPFEKIADQKELDPLRGSKRWFAKLVEEAQAAGAVAAGGMHPARWVQLVVREY